MNDKVKCPKCGHENEINSNQCSQCDQELRNYKYFKNDFKDFYKLFSSNNIELLKKLPLTDTGYDSILNSIVEIGNENYHAFPADLNIQNLIRISKPYARVQYDNENKHPGFYSYYSFNKIYLNRNTPYNIIPGAIIHELSHHMFNEIIKQSIMHLLNVEKSLYIESFAWYLTLQNDYLKIANEFASHRTQEYFDPENFNGYSSLNQLLEDNDNLDEKKILTSLNVGLSVSKDIIFILEKYVAPTIKINPNLADFHKLGYDIKGFEEQNKLNAMYTIIVQTFEFVAGHKRDMQPILDDLNNNFIRNNV